MSDPDGGRGNVDEHSRLVDSAHTRYESGHAASISSEEGIRERCRAPVSSARNGEEFDNVPKVKRTLGESKESLEAKHTC